MNWLYLISLTWIIWRHSCTTIAQCFWTLGVLHSAHLTFHCLHKLGRRSPSFPPSPSLLLPIRRKHAHENTATAQRCLVKKKKIPCIWRKKKKRNRAVVAFLSHRPCYRETTGHSWRLRRQQRAIPALRHCQCGLVVTNDKAVVLRKEKGKKKEVNLKSQVSVPAFVFRFCH